jgi:predicted nuclease of predicted toxin-antitoxin system
MQRAPDREIVDRARADSSVVLTFDLDFGEVLALGVLDRPSVVIFRLSDERPAAVNKRIAAVIDERVEDLVSGSLILIEDQRYRVRKLPIGRE